MNLGILKLYRGILLTFGVLLFTSCSFKTNDIFDSSNKKSEKKATVKKNTAKKIEIKKPIKKIVKTKKIINNQFVKKSVVNKRIVKKIKSKPVIKKQKTKKLNKNPNVRKSTIANRKNMEDFRFDFIKKGTQDNNTLLIIGGIQGDEPGGFMAASLIATHYDITKGSVWVVPNLNFYSIIKRSRGPYGDMNRKFANLSKNDPEYEIVQRIKKYILDKDVKMVLNLHDGSGFYRPMYINKNHNPNKWGQTVVIDQELLHNVKEYNDTYFISEQVIKHLNKNLLKKEDIYRIKNTHTRFGKTKEAKEMAKTLTYFAVTNGKSAFGHETSKSLSVTQRVYYKLLAIEKYMDIMGIKYKRKFKITENGVYRALNDDVSIKFDDTNIVMPLKNIRNIQKYFPINKDGVIKFLPSNPLIKIIKNKNVYTIFYGNRRLTKLEADYAEHINFDTKVDFEIDGKNKNVKFGSTIDIKDYAIIKKHKKFRVNVIGYKNKNNIETNVKIRKNQIIKKYSIERKGKLYRAEFYKGSKFVGMILLNYIN